MRKIIALFLVFSIICLYGNLYAKERRGADLKIQKKDGHQIRGELIAVRVDSLLLKESESGADVTVDVGEIKIIRIVKKSKAGLGFSAGAILGAILGYSAGDDPPGWYSITAENKAVISAILLGILGMTCGMSLGKDKRINIEGKPEAEIKEILEELRKKSRVPNFQ